MGSCLSLLELSRIMRRVQQEERNRTIVNVMAMRGPTFSVSSRHDQPKRKEDEEAEMKAALGWVEKVKPTAQFLDVEDTREFPCIVCNEDVYELERNKKVAEFLNKLSRELPQGIHRCHVRPELSVDMGCCHQTIHVGCLFTWWMSRHHWSCPHCRDVYLNGNDKQGYHSDDEHEGVLHQVFDAVTRTIWELDTEPEPLYIMSDDSDEEDRFYFVEIGDDDLSMLERLLCH